MKQLNSLIAAVLVSGLMVLGMVGIGVNALANTNVAATNVVANDTARATPTSEQGSVLSTTETTDDGQVLFTQ